VKRSDLQFTALIGTDERRIRSNGERRFNLFDGAESLLRHRLKVLTPRPFSQQSRRAPISLALRVATISPTIASLHRRDVYPSPLQP